jgi:hypothetical protein
MFVLTRRSEAAMVAGADIVGRIVRCIHPTIVVEEMAVDTVAVIVGVVVVEMEEVEAAAAAAAEVVVTEELFTAWL